MIKKSYAVSATLVEAIYEYFYSNLPEQIDKDLAKLHQHAILSFYLESPEINSNQINDWIDQYFDGNDEAPETHLFGKLCSALLTPKDKALENSSFALLNRLTNILGMVPFNF